MEEAADDAACVRCGAPVDVGFVTASAGWFGFGFWPKLGWLSGSAGRNFRNSGSE